jgi:hypothetical protein
MKQTRRHAHETADLVPLLEQINYNPAKVAAKVGHICHTPLEAMELSGQNVVLGLPRQQRCDRRVPHQLQCLERPTNMLAVEKGVEVSYWHFDWTMLHILHG